MADVQRTFSYISTNIFRGQIYSAFGVRILYFSFSLCAPLYTKFLGQETFLSCLKYIEDSLQVKFYVRIPFLYNTFNIEIHTYIPRFHLTDLLTSYLLHVAESFLRS
jgi:hypothetical protein